MTLPKGGGALRGIGETFAASSVTGTATLTVPVPLSPGRSGFGPALSLTYDSGRGNGAFGLGWALSTPSVSRKTDKGLPKYGDSDVFLHSDAEDLVPIAAGDEQIGDYRVTRYRPRVEGAFTRIERWTQPGGEAHWRSITRDNITSLYGTESGSRVTDPADPARTFRWLISGSYDDKGNAVSYEYVAENGVGIDSTAAHERNRLDSDRATGRYLKRVRYGNRVSRLTDPTLAHADWMFDIVLDYGDHDDEVPAPEPTRAWPCRADAFSDYRAGFEVRTYRLCRRILLFHSFADQPEVGASCLVRSLELGHRQDPAGTFLVSIVSRGYRKNGHGYVTAALPPLELDYSSAELQAEVQTVDSSSLENLPAGLAAGPLWVDLDGEGLSGALVQSAGCWYYKANLGGGRLAPIRTLAKVPALASVPDGRQQLLDLAGDGRISLVSFTGPVPGFFSRGPDGDWERFTTFESLPAIDWASDNLRFVDLDGDGHADVLLTEDDAFTWYASCAQRGYAPGGSVRPPWDDERGPRLVFADGTRSVYLADMTGDGLTDLVRVANGGVCYWPNLGYGRFGAKVTMDRSPIFDDADQFDQRRVRLADVDGNGLTDLAYLGSAAVSLYRNQCGNAWSTPQVIPGLCYAGEVTDVAAVDLLGTGTICLVESSAEPGQSDRRIRYVDLLGGRKPHLLTGVRNNLGAETIVTYAPSTSFYLADRAAGRPWVTRLPFPVHVVARVEVTDRIGRTRLTSRYAYSHGYYDGIEREFRGFGRIEQEDTEQITAVGGDNLLPPVLVRTWQSTGAFVDGPDILHRFAEEYWQEPGLTEEQRRRLAPPGCALPAGLDTDELIEATRALKGAVLRQETYALDGSPAQDRPYSVTSHGYDVRLLQERGANPHAVFLVTARETVELHYERTLYPVETASGTSRLADPRIAHEVTIEIDDYGNVLRSVALGYGRRYPDTDLDPDLDPVTSEAVRDEQRRAHAVLTEHRYTNPIDTTEAHRTPLRCEASTFELTGPAVEDLASLTGPLTFGEVAALVAESDRRTLSRSDTSFRSDDLATVLPLGRVESLAIPLESRRLAVTTDLLSAAFGERIPDAGPLLFEGGYLSDAAGAWIPTGRALLAPEGIDEATYAPRHFYLPQRFRDPFGTITSVRYDGNDLLPVEAVDAVGNRTTAVSDYRVLQPRQLIDPNGNRAVAAYDALGRLAGTAVVGKPGQSLGDTLDGFDPDADVSAYLADPAVGAEALLGNATARYCYQLDAYWQSRDDEFPQPPVMATLARETHVADVPPGGSSRIHRTFQYSDGFARLVQTKTPAADGGWIGSGWTIFDGKGRPVRHYEPFFTGSAGFEFAVTAGVSPVLFYDPVGRAVVTLTPDDCYDKVVFDAWRQISWDANDTVLLDPRTDDDVRGFVAQHFAVTPADWRTWYARRAGGDLGGSEQRAALGAAEHAGTPAVSYLDSLGRPFVTVAHNRTDGVDALYPSRVVLDVEGRQRQLYDAAGRLVMRYDYDLAGRRLVEASMEAGERWTLPDIAGVPIRAWDSRGHATRYEYDALRRPVRRWVRTADGPELLRERTIYGEAHPDAAAANLRTRLCRHFDSAGLATVETYDVKGNVRTATRRLTKRYQEEADWTAWAATSDEALVAAAPEDALTLDLFQTATAYDALNRPTQLTSADGSVTWHGLDAAGQLNSVQVAVHGEPAATMVSDIRYDAHGRRTSITYGNGVGTDYSYHPRTFRLTQLRTVRPAAADSRVVQDLAYTYDPVGNITQISDAVQQTIFYAGRMVQPECRYTYDATYRLITATGREHRGQTEPSWPTWNDAARSRLPHPQDARAMRDYLQRFGYDPAGNLKTINHTADGGPWARSFSYGEVSQLEPGERNNRLSASQVDGTTETFGYDPHGNMTSMPHLRVLVWGEQDRLQSVDRNGGGMVWYGYDAAGERLRTVVENRSGVRQYERIYLGGCELFRQYDVATGTAVVLTRETLHVLDDRRRIALIETRTLGTDDGPERLVRYQLDNHLGSACVELDDVAALISYEEYHPYGTTSYQAVRSQTETPKRYRYTGKERDQETGLAYHGARYYAPWLGRWTSADPEGILHDFGLFHYARSNPVKLWDPDGRQAMSALSDILRTGAGYIVGITEPIRGLYDIGDRAAQIVDTAITAGTQNYHFVTGEVPSPVAVAFGIVSGINEVVNPFTSMANASQSLYAHTMAGDTFGAGVDAGRLVITVLPLIGRFSRAAAAAAVSENVVHTNPANAGGARWTEENTSAGRRLDVRSRSSSVQTGAVREAVRRAPPRFVEPRRPAPSNFWARAQTPAHLEAHKHHAMNTATGFWGRNQAALRAATPAGELGAARRVNPQILPHTNPAILHWARTITERGEMRTGTFRSGSFNFYRLGNGIVLTDPLSGQWVSLMDLSKTAGAMGDILRAWEAATRVRR